MELLKLDREYQTGTGNYIWDQNGQQILDYTGSYGANLLGHGNEIYQKASQFLLKNQVSFTQGSYRKQASLLAEKMNSILREETEKESWQVMFSNSGTEAVEVALKVAKAHYKNDLKKFKLKYNEKINKALKIAQEKGNKNWENEINLLRERNSITLSMPAKIISLTNAFHGKTQESLKATYNTTLKKDILNESEESHIVRSKTNDKLDLAYQIEKHKVYIDIPVIEDGKLIISSINYYQIACIIAEPIQGEAGVIELTEEYLIYLREQATRINALLIFDEIQSGAYRTGRLCSSTHYGVSADIYVFAKALSAGFTKIALTCVDTKKSIPSFDLINSSTYAEDDLSSFVALEALDLAKKLYEEKQESINYLKESLTGLKNRYPGLVKEIRGKGLMLSLEFSSEIKFHSYEFKYFVDSNMLGHLFSSALLNNEGIRVAPTLSNQMCLRIQPALSLKNYEVDRLVNSFERLIKAIKNNDSSYFFDHILECEAGEFNLISHNLKPKLTKEYKSAAVFLNHPIEVSDVKDILSVLKNVPDEEIENLMELTFDIQSFTPYFAEEIIGDNGKKIDIVMLSIPVTSKILYKKFRSRDMYKVVEKIQDALSLSQTKGASTVGLGQFTSIVSKNGVFLDNLGMNLTTGNSYTAKLAYDAGQDVVIQKNKTIGLVGYGGNIISSMAPLALEDADKVILFHRGENLLTHKIEVLLMELLREIKESKSNCLLAKRLKSIDLEDGNFKHILMQLEDIIEVSNDLEQLNKCELIYTGSNSTKPIINSSMLKNNSVVVDLAVPGDFDATTLVKTKNIQIIKGGIASFPRKNNEQISIKIPSFPLKAHESFACMAETFSLGLSEIKGKINIGPISITDIKEIDKIAQDAGFTLAKSKIKNSL